MSEVSVNGVSAGAPEMPPELAEERLRVARKRLEAELKEVEYSTKKLETQIGLVEEGARKKHDLEVAKLVVETRLLQDEHRVVLELERARLLLKGEVDRLKIELDPRHDEPPWRTLLGPSVVTMWLGLLLFGCTLGMVSGLSEMSGTAQQMTTGAFTFVGGVLLTYAGFRRARSKETKPDLDPARTGVGLSGFSLGLAIGIIYGMSVRNGAAWPNNGRDADADSPAPALAAGPADATHVLAPAPMPSNVPPVPRAAPPAMTSKATKSPNWTLSERPKDPTVSTPATGVPALPPFILPLPMAPLPVGSSPGPAAATVSGSAAPTPSAAPPATASPR